MGQAIDKDGNPLGNPEMGETFSEVFKKIEAQKLKDVHEIRMKKLTEEQKEESKDLSEEEMQAFLTKLILLKQD